VIIRRVALLLFAVAALMPAIRPATAAPMTSIFLDSTLRSMYFLSDSQFASLVHWARAGAPSPTPGAPAFSVEFDIVDRRQMLKDAERQALLTFLRGGGRFALYALGVTDSQLGSRNPATVAPATPKPSPTPNPYRALEFGSPTIGSTAMGNIVVLGGWAAVKRDGRGAHTCVSFKNSDTRTATRVLFQFPISDEAGVELGQLELDRRGTFSPGIDINGWGSMASWQGSSNRRNDENCTGVSASMAALPLLAARFATYRIVRVEYGDGTSWTPATTPQATTPPTTTTPPLATASP
jgi:hypothetical protein